MRRRTLIESRPRLGKSRTADPLDLDRKLADEARFFRSWVDSPGLVGAVSPSGRFLARAMARCVDPHARGLVVELGPGTGPVTEALIERGIAPERLVLVEYGAEFCKLLRQRFPGVRIIQGDAYRLSDTLADVLDGPVAAVVSSLPLLNKPDEDRRTLLDQAFDLMGPDGLFVQFTYGINSPIPLARPHQRPAFFAEVDPPVWLNLPPARVWRYRRADHYARTTEPKRRMPKLDLPPLLEAFNQRQVAPALAKLRRFADAPVGPKGARR